jgi:hypothetical protein
MEAAQHTVWEVHMKHDFTKPTYVTSQTDLKQKRRLPIYILMLTGLFLLALILYMSAGI